ncbi:hypothetical protein [Limnohabitans sp.]|uniref:hypothetical protein n=1 Tax=Limnohabitans sp. TaxID=1907725 RepID=UPI00286EF2E5|nr:hypothetical protein [Limnohabitans sp.]
MSQAILGLWLLENEFCRDDYLLATLVNITSVPTTPNIPYDQACIVQAGQHPFVVYDSFVAYRYIRIEAIAHLAQMISLGQWKSYHAPASSSLLLRMVAGVCMSKLVNREFKKIFACP